MPHIRDIELPEDWYWALFELAARSQLKAHQQAALLIIRALETERDQEEPTASATVKP